MALAGAQSLRADVTDVCTDVQLNGTHTTKSRFNVIGAVVTDTLECQPNAKVADTNGLKGATFMHKLQADIQVNLLVRFQLVYLYKQSNVNRRLGLGPEKIDQGCAQSGPEISFSARYYA